MRKERSVCACAGRADEKTMAAKRALTIFSMTDSCRNFRLDDSLTKLGIFAVDPVKLPELDAHHVLRAFTHQALFARGFHQARDQLRRLRRVFDVGDHVGGEKYKVMIAESVMLAPGI